MAKLRLKAKLYEPIWLVCSLFASCNTIRYDFSLLYCVVLATKMFQRMCPMLFLLVFLATLLFTTLNHPFIYIPANVPYVFYYFSSHTSLHITHLIYTTIIIHEFKL